MHESRLKELAQDLKTLEDLSAFSSQLTIEAALNGQISHHLGGKTHIPHPI